MVKQKAVRASLSSQELNNPATDFFAWGNYDQVTGCFFLITRWASFTY